ncbi:MAG: 4Fe-4S dicluster domain-containing protein [Mariprofundus sp.]|nr:4Fe-4S dicluster domain-containing protein [Mariprofundus sp.]
MDRRNFFRQGAASVGKVVSKQLESHFNERAEHWIRPPYALGEVDFLLACTRCNACVQACPHEVIFNLSISCGVEVVGTPALDLTHKGCHLCSDWPCVTACPTTALQRPPETEAALAKIAIAVIEPHRCLPYQGPECGACRGSCPVPDALLWHGAKPSIDAEKCVGCGLCREACFLEEKAIQIRSLHRKESPIKAESAQ